MLKKTKVEMKLMDLHKESIIIKIWVQAKIFVSLFMAYNSFYFSLWDKGNITEAIKGSVNNSQSRILILNPKHLSYNLNINCLGRHYLHFSRQREVTELWKILPTQVVCVLNLFVFWYSASLHSLQLKISWLIQNPYEICILD